MILFENLDPAHFLWSRDITTTAHVACTVVPLVSSPLAVKEEGTHQKEQER
jgi:hypothetical protein